MKPIVGFMLAAWARVRGAENSLRWSRLGLAAGASVLGVACALQALGGLNPPSFWFDDLWVAAFAKNASFRELLALRPPAPIGFLGALQVLAKVFGDGHAPLQALALTARVLAVPAVALVAGYAARSACVGIGAGALLALNEELGGLSIRVKQFTLDVLLCTLLLALAFWFLRRPGPRRLAGLAAGSAVAMLFSFTSAFIGPLLVNLAACDLAWPTATKPGRRWRAPVALAAGFDALVLLLGLGLFRSQSGPEITAYWSGFYLPTGDWSAAMRFLFPGPAWGFVSEAFPGSAFLAAAIVPGVALLLWDRRSRMFGVFVILFYLQILAVSALRIFPMAGGRLGCFGYPIALVTAAVGVGGIVRRVPVLPALAAAALLAITVQGQLRSPVQYVGAGERESVQAIERAAMDDAWVIANRNGSFALAFYSTWGARLLPRAGTATQYVAASARDRTLVVEDTSPAALDEALRPALAGTGQRLIYFGDHSSEQEHNAILAALARRGFSVRSREKRYAAVTVHLERAAAYAGQ